MVGPQLHQAHASGLPKTCTVRYLPANPRRNQLLKVGDDDRPSRNPLLPWRPRVLRSCDMEHVMLHLIFSLPHAWGGTTRSGTLPLLFDSGGFTVGSLSAPDNDSFGTSI